MRMPGLLLRHALLVTLLATLPILLIRAQAYDDSELRVRPADAAQVGRGRPRTDEQSGAAIDLQVDIARSEEAAVEVDNPRVGRDCPDGNDFRSLDHQRGLETVGEERRGAGLVRQ